MLEAFDTDMGLRHGQHHGRHHGFSSVNTMFVIILSLLALLPVIVLSAIPFSLDGALDRFAIVLLSSDWPFDTDPCLSATADSAVYNAGGKISVNGLTITIPQNLQFQAPAAWLPFKQIAAGGFIGHEVSVHSYLVVSSIVTLDTNASQVVGN